MIGYTTLFFAAVISVLCCHSAVFIPPIGAYNQLKNFQSDLCLYSNSNTGGFGDGTCKSENDDNYWYLNVEHTSNSGYYQIKNKQSGKCLYSNSNNNGFGAGTCKSQNDDNYWKFTAKPGDESESYVEIRNLQSNQCLYSNSNTGGFGDGNCGGNNDNYWKFLIEDYEFIEVDFDLDFGEIIGSNPLIVGEGECDNSSGGSTSQTVTITVSKTITETSSFTHTAGISISIGATFSIGIPFVANGEISTEITGSYSHTWGSTRSETRTFGASLPVTCGVGEIIQVDCSVNVGNLEVPYTITLKTIESQVTFQSYGIWRGSQGYAFDCDFNHVSV